MHICFLTRNYDERSMGGRNPSMRYYDRALREAGHEVTIISVPMHPENSNKTVDNVHYTNYFASLSYDLNLIFSIPRLYAKCVELNKSCAFDVVHSLYREFCGIAGVLLKWRLGLPLVQWMYDLGYESQKASLLETGRSRWATPLLLAYLKYGEKLVLGRLIAYSPLGQTSLRRVSGRVIMLNHKSFSSTIPLIPSNSVPALRSLIFGLSMG